MVDDDYLQKELMWARAEVARRYGAGGEDWKVVFAKDHSGGAWIDSTANFADKVAVMFVDRTRGADFIKWDLVHESVHLLNPGVPMEEISSLEEAAAVTISFDPSFYSGVNFVADRRAVLESAVDNATRAYLDALRHLEPLLKFCPELIPELRGKEGKSLSTQLMPCDIMKLSGCNEAVAKALCSKPNKK
jgi:hypothetical protein